MEKLSIEVRKGATVVIPLRLESGTLVFKQITAMSQSAPLEVTVPSHGLPPVWRVGFQNTPWDDLNSPWDDLSSSAMRLVSAKDGSTIVVDGLNSSGFTPYTSGGQIVYYSPIDLSIYASARMDVKTRPGGALLASYSTADGQLYLDNTNKAVVLRLIPTDTEGVRSGKWSFDIEMVANDGSVLAICSPDSEIVFLQEVTTSV